MTGRPGTERRDPLDRRVARRAEGVLRAANESGALEAADVHVAQRLGRLTGEDEPAVLLATALVVRAVRQGSVCLDLAGVDLDGVDLGVAASAVRDGAAWTRAVAASRLAAAGAVHVDHGLVYLDRYLREEQQVEQDLRARGDQAPPVVETARLEAALEDWFPSAGGGADGAPDFTEQRAAAARAATSWTTVVTGGPGTGKTTTVARLLGTLLDVAPGPLRVALAAPTGKAAARMTEAVQAAVARSDVPAAHREQLSDLRATTLHRLLGWRPGSQTRFRHDRHDPLPHDVVVVDETSMVSLTLMARLLEALRPQTRLVLVGDADQLASVDAGAVLHDLVDGLEGAGDTRVGGTGAVARLTRTHRYDDTIGALAEAVRTGDADAALAALHDGRGAVRLVTPGSADDDLVAVARRLLDAARGAEPGAALAALEQHRLLLAHRAGEYGVAHWNRRIERRLREETATAGGAWGGEWYAGRPLLVTANDYGLGLFNGDTGVVVRQPGGGLVARLADGSPDGRALPVSRLADVETAHAMTVHRSQGSQFRRVTVVLPPPDSPLLTRELLYTAVTRAQESVTVVGTADAVRAAVERPARRASGLARRLTDPATA
ncbi:exodeoxyribonuclease V subunit alpha [Lapillicoccus jejuensis]|uniref:RecBCD enzyme subunit RecD n=1 Tax=Lapillicoccus jejuensis TaxID=402171 RepID=A0A542E743_9MICO|nr:exodeoxyribonuclease V subunit alpha [Lapillicoccus jejuensis]TQJ11076.1 DNA helicase/exodeoxyribonuclease V alpha subunit [Lapillicoccus jejuensis]